MDKCYNHDYHDPCVPERKPSPCDCGRPTMTDPFNPCDKPGFCPPPQKPPMPCMPPVPSVCEGQSLYEAMNVLTGRVNTCIETYNHVMAENYKTLHNLQRAAEENGAYYGPCEVWVEEGYYPDESATYHLIHKALVDRRGEPIRMQLHLAYGNTTNSQIEQDLFSASKVTYADKIVVAQPKGENGWYGRAIWKGCPIASDPSEELYTVGFTKSGHMRVYQNSVSVDQMLRDTIENAMGCSGVLIQNGQLCEDSWLEKIPNYDKQVERVIMGQNLDTKEVIFLVCGNEDNVHRKGITTKAAAKILLSYGVDVAVELCEGADAGAADKGSLMFVPEENKAPTAYCYWVISRKCYYKTDYERELAELIQNYGRCIWEGYLNKKNIEKVKAELDQEILDRIAGDEKLQENIDKEEAARKEADRILQENIDKEAERAKGEEARIEGRLNDEIKRATDEEQRIEGKLDEEITRAKSEESRIEGKLDEEISRAKSEESRIESKLDDEISRSTAEDKRLDDKIDQEIHDRTNEDAKLHQEILTEQGERIAADKVLQNNINQEAATRASEDTRITNEMQAKIDAEANARSDADTALGVRIDGLVTRIVTIESNIKNLQDLTAKLQEQMSSLDTTVTEIMQTIADIETTLNNLKVQITNMNTTINQIISGEIELPYVKKSGDTMTGVLNFDIKAVDGNNATVIKIGDKYEISYGTGEGANIRIGEISGDFLELTDNGGGYVGEDGYKQFFVEDPNSDNSAVNLRTLKKAIGDYVLKSGDTMTGNLNMSNESEIRFIDKSNDSAVLMKLVDSGENPNGQSENFDIVLLARPTITPQSVNSSSIARSGVAIVLGDGFVDVYKAMLEEGEDPDNYYTNGYAEVNVGDSNNGDTYQAVNWNSLNLELKRFLLRTGGNMVGNIRFYNGNYASDGKQLGTIARTDKGVSVSSVNGAYVKVEDSITVGDNDGGDMQIHGVKAGTADTDAVNVKQLNDAVADLPSGDYVSKTGDTMSGQLSIITQGQSLQVVGATTHNGALNMQAGDITLGEGQYVNFGNTKVTGNTTTDDGNTLYVFGKTVNIGPHYIKVQAVSGQANIDFTDTVDITSAGPVAITGGSGTTGSRSVKVNICDTSSSDNVPTIALSGKTSGTATQVKLTGVRSGTSSYDAVNYAQLSSMGVRSATFTVSNRTALQVIDGLYLVTVTIGNTNFTASNDPFVATPNSTAISGKMFGAAGITSRPSTTSIKICYLSNEFDTSTDDTWTVYYK